MSSKVSSHIEHENDLCTADRIMTKVVVYELRCLAKAVNDLVLVQSELLALYKKKEEVGQAGGKIL